MQRLAAVAKNTQFPLAQVCSQRAFFPEGADQHSSPWTSLPVAQSKTWVSVVDSSLLSSNPFRKWRFYLWHSALRRLGPWWPLPYSRSTSFTLGEVKQEEFGYFLLSSIDCLGLRAKVTQSSSIVPSPVSPNSKDFAWPEKQAIKERAPNCFLNEITLFVSEYREVQA